jgi:4-amino-4-deoxy-L-arabinose transferase-like glycosyltransferase
MSPRAQARAGALLVAVVVGALFASDLGGYPLLDPDEARHAEVAREMAEAPGVRRLFLPTLELEPYREKPAPFYWLVSAAYAVGGVGESSARAASAVGGFLVVLLVYAWTVPRAGPLGAIGAALVLATTAGWFGLSRYVNLDMTLSACAAAGVLAGLAWLERAAPRRRPLVPYLAAAAATLVKGPVGAVLVAGPLLLAGLTRRPRPALHELGLVRGSALFCLIVGLFWATVWLLDASYLAAFTSTNLRRFGDHAPHAEPFWYYLVWLPVIFLPWTLVAAPALVRAARDPGRRALVLWAVFVPGLLSLVSGKLATYALSALVPLALIVGPEVARAARDGVAPGEVRVLRIGGLLGVVLLVAAAIAVWPIRSRFPIAPGAALLLSLAALGWAIATTAALIRDRPGLVPAAVLGAALTIYPLATHYLAPAIATQYSHRDAAQVIRAAGDAPVIAFAARAPSLVFYLGAPAIRTDDLAVVDDLFANNALVFLVAGHRHFTRIEARLGTRVYRWYETKRRALYANQPPPAQVDGNGSR